MTAFCKTLAQCQDGSAATYTFALLNDNQLTSLPAGVFEFNTALTILHLENNTLSSLPLGLFDELDALEELFLGDNLNDLECDGSGLLPFDAPTGAVCWLSKATNGTTAGVEFVGIPDAPAEISPSGNCVRRCGTVGWGRTFGYKAEEDADSSFSLEEDDKYFYQPFGFNMGWGMMPPPMFGGGWGGMQPFFRHPPPMFQPMPFGGWYNPFFMAPLGPPTPGFYAPPSNQAEALNNDCMRALAGSCRCSCDDDCLDNGDCCMDYDYECAIEIP
jgi:hypothetical protein